MAAYPSYWILDTSSIGRVDGFVPVRASNGALKIRKTMASEKSEFTIEHLLTKAEKDALESFYQTNKTLDVTLTWPGYTSGAFTVRFVSAPISKGMQGMLFMTQVKMAQV